VKAIPSVERVSDRAVRDILAALKQNVEELFGAASSSASTSGLDAATLQGVKAAEFARATHKHGAASIGAVPDPATPARGDILVYGASGWARLPVGTVGQVLTSDGTDPYWA